MALPADIELRHPAGTDVEAVLVLVLTTACQVADAGRSDCELADVREQWTQADVDLARDAWIARDAGGDALGYAFLHGGWADVRVHPRARGLGLGSHLRELVEARAAERGVRELRQVVAGGNRPAERLLEDGGYAPVHHAWRMERPLDVAPAAPRWPRRVVSGALEDEHDAAEVLALLERSAATALSGEALALDRFHAEHLAEERVEPELCVLARRREALVGAAVCETWDESDGSIVQLAVDPAVRRRGIGRALLLEALARLRVRGLATAVLHVGGREPAPLALYASVGMRPVWRQTSWRKRLV